MLKGHLLKFKWVIEITIVLFEITIVLNVVKFIFYLYLNSFPNVSLLKYPSVTFWCCLHLFLVIFIWSNLYKFECFTHIFYSILTLLLLHFNSREKSVWAVESNCTGFWSWPHLCSLEWFTNPRINFFMNTMAHYGFLWRLHEIYMLRA